MNILKYYCICYICFGTLCSIFTCGKEQDLFAFFMNILLNIPVIIYLFLK